VTALKTHDTLSICFIINEPHRADLEEIDLLAVRHLQQLERRVDDFERNHSHEKDMDVSTEELTFSTHLSDGTRVALKAGGGGADGTPSSNRVAGAGAEGSVADLEEKVSTGKQIREFVRLVELCRLTESASMLRAFQDGLSAVLPIEVFPLFSNEEIERLICGVSEVDVDLLQQCTE